MIRLPSNISREMKSLFDDWKWSWTQTPKCCKSHNGSVAGVVKATPWNNCGGHFQRGLTVKLLHIQEWSENAVFNSINHTLTEIVRAVRDRTLGRVSSYRPERSHWSSWGFRLEPRLIWQIRRQEDSRINLNSPFISSLLLTKSPVCIYKLLAFMPYLNCIYVQPPLQEAKLSLHTLRWTIISCEEDGVRMRWTRTIAFFIAAQFGRMSKVAEYLGKWAVISLLHLQMNSKSDETSHSFVEAVIVQQI